MKRNNNIFSIMKISVLLLILLISVVTSNQVTYAKSKKPSLNYSSVTLFYDSVHKIFSPSNNKLYLRIANGTEKAKWSTSNEKVATVSDHGTVTAISAGKATISCKIGKNTLKCKVTVKKAPDMDKIAKKVKVSYKRIDDYLKITIKNPYDYAIGASAYFYTYDSNGEKIEIIHEGGSLAPKGKIVVYAEIRKPESVAYIEKGTPKVYLTSLDERAIIEDSNCVTYKFEGFSRNEISFDTIYCDISMKNNTDFPIIVCATALLYNSDKKLVDVFNVVSHDPIDARATKTDSITSEFLSDGIRGTLRNIRYNEGEEALLKYLNDNYTVKIIPVYAYTVTKCND